MMTGGQIVVRTLCQLGVSTVYSVSGNQILPVFDAAMDSKLRIIHMRHESAAAYAAGASAELHERPGVLLVTAGPGFLGAAIGVATTKIMELPLLFLSGAGATSDAGAGGFQDLDQGLIARVTCKATMHVHSTEQIHPTLVSAWRVAQSSVPGPVHVSLPSDVLRAAVAAAPEAEKQPDAVDSALDDETTLRAMAQALGEAERPLIIARQSASRGAAGRALYTLARQLAIKPIVTESPRGLNDPKYREIVRQFPKSDCVLAVCPADFAVGFLAEDVIARTSRLLHVDARGEPAPRRIADLRTRVPADVALKYLAEALGKHQPRVPEWGRLWSTPREDDPIESSPLALHPLEVARQVRAALHPNDIIVLDGGEFCQWVRQGLRDVENRILWNSKLGGIGGSIPMAIGVAAAGHEGRTIAFVGDGSFGYHSSEFETAARYGLPIVVIVGNDGRWGAEWHLQVSRYGPNRTYETDLLSARYDQVASGLGATGFHITDPASLRTAITTAVGSGRPTCLNVAILSIRSPAVAP